MLEYSDLEKRLILKDLLIKRRKTLRINQKIAAERIGVHVGTYQQWEQANNLPEVANLVNVTRFLGLAKVSELWSVLEGTAQPETVYRKPLAEVLEAIMLLPPDEVLEVMGAAVDRQKRTLVGN
jgi:transcriptional regulator with XRE-family HTH domain